MIYKLAKVVVFWTALVFCVITLHYAFQLDP